eukprot:2777202-Pyramimonas_sp.AAC.1
MPMAKSMGMVFAGRTCYGAEARHPVRPSYSAESLAAARDLGDCYPIIAILHELHAGTLTPTQLKDTLELGGLGIKVILTIDAESALSPCQAKT